MLKTKNIPLPTKVDFAITGHCNLRCKHCNTSDTYDLENELSFEEIKRIFCELKDAKVFDLSFFGGEPFLHLRIHDILDILNDYPIRVTFLTNATLIDEKIIGKLKKLRFLSLMQVSMDGSSSDIHDWQRGEGSFVKSYKAIKQMLKNGLPVSIKAIINTHNYKDIEGMILMAKDIGLRAMDFGEAVECGSAVVNSSDLSFEGEMHRFMMKEMIKMRAKYPDFTLRGSLAQKLDMLEDFYAGGEGNGSRGTYSKCGAGHKEISIRSDGKVVPCSVFWTNIAGDLRKQSFKEIWEESSVLNHMRDIVNKPLTENHSKCSGCDYLSYCNGGCRACAYYTSNKDMEGIDKSTCLTFSNIDGYRLSKEEIMSTAAVGGGNE